VSKPRNGRQTERLDARDAGGMTMQTLQRAVILAFTLIFWVTGSGYAAWVVTENGKVYIEDRTGERWDVTQVQQLGFIPQKFQYGIGKNAFVPLDDEDFTNNRPSKFSNIRIIGVSVEGDAHAYTVDRLKRHEIANTTIAGRAIAAGY
jgi:hypothetical protein